MDRLNKAMVQACGSLHGKAAGKLAQTRGQGTTEYAILVGVLVVIAILAIMVFRPKLQELWNAIADGINGL
jgi:Flp pilus assembly pilin Flp